MKHTGLFIGLIAALALPGAQGFAKPAAKTEYVDATCAPVGQIRFVCGRSAPEDIAPIPGTDWVITSSFTGAVGLHLVSRRDENIVAAIYPSPDAQVKQDMATYGDCPGPVDAQGDAIYVAHGIALRRVDDHTFTLYVAHHGSRESVEVFNIDIPKGGKLPVTTWIGCAVVPGQETVNSVALLPDNGFVVSSTFEKSKTFKVPTTYSAYRQFSGDPLLDSGAPGVTQKREAGEDTGYLLEWHPHAGWSKVPGSDGSGVAAVEASKDGKSIYFSITGAKLVRITHGPEPLKRDVIPVNGLEIDNIKWSADGKKIMAAGNPLSSRELGKVVLVDAETLLVTDLLNLPVRVTTAIQVGKDIWMGSSRALRVMIVPMPGGR